MWHMTKKKSPINKAILFGPQGAQASQSWRKSTLNIHWKDWCWSWSSNILATWCKESIHWKRPWCWGRLRAGGEGDVRGQDGWMASLTQRTWVWANSGRWWRTGKPGVLQSQGLQRVRHDWATEQQLNEAVEDTTPSGNRHILGKTGEWKEHSNKKLWVSRRL